MELSKLRAVKVGGKWRLTEVSKTEDDFGKDGN